MITPARFVKTLGVIRALKTNTKYPAANSSRGVSIHSWPNGPSKWCFNWISRIYARCIMKDPRAHSINYYESRVCCIYAEASEYKWGYKAKTKKKREDEEKKKQLAQLQNTERRLITQRERERVSPINKSPQFCLVLLLLGRLKIKLEQSRFYSLFWASHWQIGFWQG